jgi:hypothetical protein
LGCLKVYFNINIKLDAGGAAMIKILHDRISKQPSIKKFTRLTRLENIFNK